MTQQVIHFRCIKKRLSVKENHYSLSTFRSTLANVSVVSRLLVFQSIHSIFISTYADNKSSLNQFCQIHFYTRDTKAQQIGNFLRFYFRMSRYVFKYSLSIFIAN